MNREHFNLPSYRKCGNKECYFDSEEQPCWGQTKIVDESSIEDDFWWVHACEGHIKIATREGGYIQSNRTEDAQFR